MSEETAPLLPSVPVDFNALHDALAADKGPDAAAEAGIAAFAPPEVIAADDGADVANDGKSEKSTKSKRATAGTDADGPDKPTTNDVPGDGAASE